MTGTWPVAKEKRELIAGACIYLGTQPVAKEKRELIADASLIMFPRRVIAKIFATYMHRSHQATTEN